VAVASESGIGVQKILPREGTRWQGGRHAPDRQDDHKASRDAPPDEPAPAPPAPAAPGTGLIVDKSV